MDLKPGKLILYFGLFCFAISLLLIYVLFFVLKEYENGGLLSVLGMLIGFSLIGLYLTLHYFKYRIIIGDKSMTINNEIGQKEEIYWNDIEKVDYNKTFNIIVIWSNQKKKWISPIYGHFIDFIEPEKYTEKLKRIIN
ncbi:hypothetical protein EYD45_03110 [Hyunsoonleella flava]|uniref:Uncharacterized protein n=1 Tax=Hyunsoonleella flava TaxID=2527939 RepID=A0A4V2JAI9_9FLAO|nr:hypothetical protein [Hyunsoonleella flava]TBN06886.1 hypothetical protein EYD45_03110 [Hyunsoonleella flava]